MKIKKGMKFNIEPSDGFLGITPGEVSVVRIAKYEDVYEEYVDPEHLVEVDSSLKKANWVVYRYVNPTTPDMHEGYCLDEATFKEHVTIKNL